MDNPQEIGRNEVRRAVTMKAAAEDHERCSIAADGETLKDSQLEMRS